MSAIFGICTWQKGKTSILPMEDKLRKYKIERFGRIEEVGVSFGCGIQYFTKEASGEVLPKKSQNGDILITADVVLDNRQELIDKLKLEDKMIPDGELVLQSFLQWGEECGCYLRGVYAFAIYDIRKERLYLYTDHTGSRTLYCYRGKKGFYFSTTFAPILAMEREITWNEKWITACEAIQTPDMEMFSQITPYQGILQLESGCYLEISSNEIKKKRYWNPKYEKKRKFCDEECKRIFLETFSSCVKDVIPQIGNVGAMVSSGLDSTAVACLSSRYLEKEGKKLYTYTSVPERDYQEVNPSVIADETWGPLELQKLYKNIEPQFISCEGMNGFSKLNDLVPLLEFPTKSAPNIMWIDEIYKKAVKDGCKVLLKGQFGNATISYGKILTLVHSYVKKARLIEAIKQINMFGKKNNVSRKRILKTYFRIRKEKEKGVDWLEESLVKKELLEKYEINKTIQESKKQSGGGLLDTEEQRIGFLLDTLSFSQLATYDTRFSLIYGVLVRDPAKDKRMIELCMQLPIECFVYQGVERRMIREYMKETVPDTILSVIRQRGKQSADYVNRIQKHWQQQEEDIIEKLQDEKMFTYFEEDKINHLIEKMKKQQEEPLDKLEALFANAMNLYAFSVFLGKND